MPSTVPVPRLSILFCSLMESASQHPTSGYIGDTIRLGACIECHCQIYPSPDLDGMEDVYEGEDLKPVT